MFNKLSGMEIVCTRGLKELIVQWWMSEMERGNDKKKIKINKRVKRYDEYNERADNERGR